MTDIEILEFAITKKEWEKLFSNDGNPSYHFVFHFYKGSKLKLSINNKVIMKPYSLSEVDDPK